MNIDIVVMDYDRTIADEESLMINEELKSFLKIIPQKKILATGRTLNNIPDKSVFKIFDAIVAENGTVVVINGVKEILPNKNWNILKELIIKASEKRNLKLLYGEVIIFGRIEDYEKTLDLLEKEGMLKEIFIDFNKNNFMILPKYWNKGKGVKIVIEKIGGGKVMAIGDELNDLSLFEIADIKVAVSNAIPEVKSKADIICEEKNGKGVLQILKKYLRCK
ncbi:MAG: HAD hydrolase family protein [Candidatus Methanomethylicaceae archaeon]|nr:HAD hydrolase family protein [Candidatus Verstraetearchaeota archaeon]